MMINIISHMLIPNDKTNWDIISNSISLNDEFIDANSEKLNWDIISSNHKLCMEFIQKHINDISWSKVLLNPSFTLEHLILFIEKFTDDDLKYYIRFKKLDNEQIKQIGLAKKMTKGV